MANSLMYCSEQIAIPETFPNILKNYAKAAIRTQPYDLLRWSASYFRCLAQNEAPPAKSRLENVAQCGSITKGYLRVLLDQVGKGYYINKDVLLKKWEGLCLPEEDLFRYLSLCRMMNWKKVHWLKLFAVMVGSLNETPENTIAMLCELLTDDVEGGPARIPMWMFRIVYTFIAELDCSKEQIFVNGRRKRGDGEFEPELVMEAAPKVISTTSLQNQIMNECLLQYNEEHPCDGFTKTIDPSLETQSVSNRSGDGRSSDELSTVSSGFQIAGKSGDTKQIIQKCGDFDSLILLLWETQGAKLHEYAAPHKITSRNIDHAKRREAKVEQDKGMQVARQGENTKKYLHLESVNLLREAGPPWSWIHQFVNNNCINTSYNFIEETSVASDVTPPESSDESFDFCRGKQISGDESESDTHLFSTSTDNPEELIKEEKAAMHPMLERRVISTIKESLIKAKSEGDIDLSDTYSIVSYINKDEVGVLLRGGERAAPHFSVEILDQIFRNALEHGKVFDSIDDVMDYIKQHYNILSKEHETKHFMDNGYSQILQDGEKLISDKISEGESIKPMSKVSHVSSVSSQQEAQTIARATDEAKEEFHVQVKKKPSLSIDDSDTENLKSVLSVDQVKVAGVLENNAQIIQTPSDQLADDRVVEMENVFELCGMEPDQKVLTKKISGTMILGLADKDISMDAGGEEVASSTLESSQNDSSRGGYVSDVSNTVVSTPQPETKTRKNLDNDFLCELTASMRIEAEKSPVYECVVPPYSGIGRSVSKKTIENFLTYLKFRSRSQKGMVYPRNFREDKCPKMVD